MRGIIVRFIDKCNQLWSYFIRFLVNVKKFFFGNDINKTHMADPVPSDPAPVDPAPVDPTPEDPVVVAPEDKVQQLADELKSAVTNVLVDVANLQKVIAFLEALKQKGYPTDESLVKMNEKLSLIQTNISDVNTLLEPKVQELKNLGESLADDLPSL